MESVAYDCRFRDTAKIVVSGASGSGKTQLVKRMLVNHLRVFEVTPPSKIVVFHTHYQKAYDELREEIDVPVEFVKGPPPDGFTPPPKSVLVFDDLQSTDSNEIREFFLRKCHHSSCAAVIYVLQNVFAANKNNRDITLNADYFVCFRPRRDLGQVERLNYSLLGRGHRNFLVSVFKELTHDRPHSFLLIDIAATTPAAFQFRSTVVPQSGSTRVFVPHTHSDR